MPSLQFSLLKPVAERARVAALKRCAQAWFALRCPVHIEFNKQEFASYGSASQSGKLTAIAHFALTAPEFPSPPEPLLFLGRPRSGM